MRWNWQANPPISCVSAMRAGAAVTSPTSRLYKGTTRNLNRCSFFGHPRCKPYTLRHPLSLPDRVGACCQRLTSWRAICPTLQLRPGPAPIGSKTWSSIWRASRHRMPQKAGGLAISVFPACCRARLQCARVRPRGCLPGFQGYSFRVPQFSRNI